MRILQIGATFVGAQEKIEQSIHTELSSYGNESYILYAFGNSNDTSIICYENILEQLIRRILNKALGRKCINSKISTLKLLKYIKRIDPDLIHLHIIHNGYLDYVFLFKYLAKIGVPVVYTVHDMWAFTGGCYYYTSEHCDNWMSGCIDCKASRNKTDNSPTKSHVFFQIKKKMFASLKYVHFVAVSNWVADEMKKSFLGKYPISVIENGLNGDFESFNSNNAELAELVDRYICYEKRNILSVAAAWDKRKGIYRIFEIAKQLGEGYNIILVGSYTEELKQSAPTNIKFVGYLKRKELLKCLYQKTDLYMSASDEETFGMTFIEAAFAGTKSIGYASTAIGETLGKVNGYIVDEVTPGAMVEKINEIFEHGNPKLSDKEIKNIIFAHSSQTMAKKYVELYRNILSIEGEACE